MSTPVEVRFWERVDRSGECWTWTGFLHKGYGALSVENRKRPVHRLSWELNVGPIPEGMSILHRCDNPSCVRPSHLFLGTQADNIRDAFEKGRLKRWNPRRGEENAKAKITEEDVRAIRRLAERGVPARVIAPLFGLKMGAVSHIVTRRNWSHVI